MSNGKSQDSNPNVSHISSNVGFPQSTLSLQVQVFLPSAISLWLNSELSLNWVTTKPHMLLSYTVTFWEREFQKIPSPDTAMPCVMWIFSLAMPIGQGIAKCVSQNLKCICIAGYGCACLSSQHSGSWGRRIEPEFEASLGYLARASLNKIKQTKKNCIPITWGSANDVK
jgi:hypothetical protein